MCVSCSIYICMCMCIRLCVFVFVLVSVYVYVRICMCICKILELFARSWSPNSPIQFSKIRSPANRAQLYVLDMHSYMFAYVLLC